jgi:hypothetical protein
MQQIAWINESDGKGIRKKEGKERKVRKECRNWRRDEMIRNERQTRDFPLKSNDNLPLVSE